MRPPYLGGIETSDYALLPSVQHKSDGRPAPPMTARGLVLIAAALGLATAAPASAAGSKPAAPASKPAAPEKSTPRSPPIVFFLAKGDANACGVGCSEWIAADGAIDAGADGRLRALLKKLGGRKLPIFFHSPGGTVPTGLAIGRLLRQHGMTAGVGWTVPAGCDPKQQNEPACDKLKRSGRDLVAVLDTGHTMCNSSCVYALVGAAVREVGAGVGLGVHSSSVSFSLKRIDGGGHVTVTPTRVAPTVERKALENVYVTISSYLREMDISPDLLTAARGVDNSQVHLLTRDQLVAFGIDRRAVVEGLWWFVDGTAGASALKVIEENRDGAFRKDILRLTCRNASTVRLDYGRSLDAHVWGWPVGRLRVTASGGSFPFSNPSTSSSSDGRMEVRSVELPSSVLGDVAFTIEEDNTAALITGVTPQKPSISKLAVQGAGPGLGELGRRCGSGPGGTKGAPAEQI
jgi:hypothetical protein